MNWNTFTVKHLLGKSKHRCSMKCICRLCSHSLFYGNNEGAVVTLSQLSKIPMPISVTESKSLIDGQRQWWEFKPKHMDKRYGVEGKMQFGQSITEVKDHLGIGKEFADEAARNCINSKSYLSSLMSSNCGSKNHVWPFITIDGNMYAHKVNSANAIVQLEVASMVTCSGIVYGVETFAFLIQDICISNSDLLWQVLKNRYVPIIASKLLVSGVYKERNCCRVFGFNMGLSLLPVKLFYWVSLLNSFAARSWLNHVHGSTFNFLGLVLQNKETTDNLGFGRKFAEKVDMLQYGCSVRGKCHKIIIIAPEEQKRAGVFGGTWY